MIPWILLSLLMLVYCITLPQLLQRAGHKMPWLGYIPVVQFIPTFQILKHPVWYILIMLCPGINLLMLIVINVEIGIAFSKRSTKDQWFFGTLPWYALIKLAFQEKEVPFVGPRDWTGKKKSFQREWGEAILFAVIAASVIRTFFIEAFTIPTPSMENSMLVGDYLFVSKVSYGAKIPQTPMSIPFLHNAMPGKSMANSYVEWFSLPYYRLPGLGNVERFDPVVFNYPHGDTIVVDPFLAGHDYYDILRNEAMAIASREAKLNFVNPEDYAAFLKDQEKYLQKARVQFNEKKSCISCANNIKRHGGTRPRPMDKKENYVKRCIGLPGETIEIKDHVVYINGSAIQDPEGVMYNYILNYGSEEQFTGIVRKMNVAPANINMLRNNHALLPLTMADAEKVKNLGGVLSLKLYVDSLKEENYMQMFPNLPKEPYNHWTVDNFGPLHIPYRGETIQLTPDNVDLYRHTIVNYEGNTLEQRDGKVYINGGEATTYTFKQDYYWMMGDNRHHSVDSRFWGWVPEDHIVGKPVFTWFSKNQENHNNSTSVRWNRVFRLVD
jgi:signal peptidase I